MTVRNLLAESFESCQVSFQSPAENFAAVFKGFSTAGSSITRRKENVFNFCLKNFLNQLKISLVERRS